MMVPRPLRGGGRCSAGLKKRVRFTVLEKSTLDFVDGHRGRWWLSSAGVTQRSPAMYLNAEE